VVLAGIIGVVSPPPTPHTPPGKAAAPRPSRGAEAGPAEADPAPGPEAGPEEAGPAAAEAAEAAAGAQPAKPRSRTRPAKTSGRKTSVPGWRIFSRSSQSPTRTSAT
jgi:hypothetical protein